MHQSIIEQPVFARGSMPFFSQLFAQCTNAVLAKGTWATTCPSSNGYSGAGSGRVLSLVSTPKIHQLRIIPNRNGTSERTTSSHQHDGHMTSPGLVFRHVHRRPAISVTVRRASRSGMGGSLEGSREGAARLYLGAWR